MSMELEHVEGFLRELLGDAVDLMRRADYQEAMLVIAGAEAISRYIQRLPIRDETDRQVIKEVAPQATRELRELSYEVRWRYVRKLLEARPQNPEGLEEARATIDRYGRTLERALDRVQHLLPKPPKE